MRKIIFVFVLIVLSACATPPAPGNSIAPNVAAEAARQTGQAYQAQEEFYNAQSTSTAAALTAIAYAPIMQMTQTAAEFAMQQTYAQATSTAAAQTQTAYAMQQAYIAQSTSTAGVATQVAAVTQQAFQVQVQNDRMDLERAQLVNRAKALSVYAFGIAFLFVAVAYAFTLIKKAAFMPNPVDERGKPQPMMDVVEGTAWDIDRTVNGMLGTRKSFLKQLPAITAERQNEVTARAQMVDMATRRARLPQRLLEAQGVKGLLPEPLAESFDAHFLLPSWEIINGWQGEGLPYYTAKGLQTIDTERHPHLAVLGETGSGKTRGFLRPVIACALAGGHRVVVIGESTDYWLFEEHANARLLKVNKITEPDQALLYADILRAIVAEMHRRDDVLTAKRQSTWTRAGLPLTYIVLDEFGNALNVMDKVDRKIANQCRAWAEVLTGKGRKAGLSILLANQRATGMASILANTGAAIFRVTQKEEQAQPFMRGAGALQKGYFLARFDSHELAGAFEPTDDEIRQFLASRPVNTLGDDDQWIEGVVSDAPGSLPGDQQDALPPPAAPSTVASLARSLTDQEAKIIQMHQNGTSKSEIARELFGYPDGSAFNKVSSVIKRYVEAKNATTTPLNTPNLGTAVA